MLNVKKRSFCLILSFVMLLATACGAWAIEPNADGVYEIGTADELAAFRDMVNAGSNTIDGKLTADITMPDEAWWPIGTYVFEGGASYDHTYHGTFDGNGKSIKGLVTRSSDVAYYDTGGVMSGLFGAIGSSTGTGVVQNLVLTDIDADFSDYNDRAAVAGIVSYLNGGQIKNCGVVGGSIKGAATNGITVGTIVSYGSNDSSTGNATGAISNCFVEGLTVLEGSDNVGGLASTLNSGTKLTNSYVSKVTLIKSHQAYAGGLVGYFRNSLGSPGVDDVTTISNCYAENIGEVNSVINIVSTLVGSMRAQDQVLMQNCVYLGSGKMTGSTEGGILGNIAYTTTHISKLLNCLYPGPDVLTFSLGVDRPIGNISNDDLATAGRSDLSPYDPDDANLPAIVAALDHYTISVVAGETAALSVDTYPGTKGSLTYDWDIDDTSIASIAGSGTFATITANAVGSTTATVTITGDIGVTLSCVVNVTEEGSSTPTSYGGGGSSNCNAGMGASALLSLLGLALVLKKK